MVERERSLQTAFVKSKNGHRILKKQAVAEIWLKIPPHPPHPPRQLIRKVLERESLAVWGCCVIFEGKAIPSLPPP